MDREEEKSGSQKVHKGGEVEESAFNVASKFPDIINGWNVFENTEEGEILASFNMGKNTRSHGGKGNVFSRLGRPHRVFKRNKAQAQNNNYLVPGVPSSKKKEKG
ncbi:hypothetical protein Hanom_Chr09g00760741 [Helianthus anomalus]